MARVLDKVIMLLAMTKPVQLALLMVTMFGAYFAAGGSLNVELLALLFITGLGSAGGVTALNMYLERDIDRVMSRTRSRPLPSGGLTPFEALTGIVFLIVIGTVAASLINTWVLLTTLVGLYFDIIAYTELFKRHTAWALLAGSVAGSMPALGGWAAATGSIDMLGILMAGMVYVWQPLHVSFIHYAYSKDFMDAGVPTIYACLGDRAYGLISLASLLSLLSLVWAFAALAGYGLTTGVVSTIVGLRAIRAVLRFLSSPSREGARRIVKLASPTLGIIFVLLPLERVILGLVGV
ncbi:MAG: UbiA family prenyltransferase [Desulfurococcales archaeon]|nr:UbiA family prenyltransferase [Desulfurococcales archaeon]